MNIVILLFLLGVLLLAGEVFMLGAVLGILGALCMAAGCVISFLQLGSSGGLVATAVALILLGLTLYLELIWLPKTKFGKKLIVQSTIAVTPLVPSGYVLVEGHRYEAFSPAGHVDKGQLLRVSGLDNFRLIVTKP